MFRNKYISSFALFFFIAVALGAFYHLFLLRFDRGDVWPAYSSLRSDPLGTRALFESLEKMENFSVVRNHRSLSEIRSGKDRTLIYAGAMLSGSDQAPRELTEAFEDIAMSGARVFISFLPEKPKKKTARKDNKKPDKEEKSEAPPESGKESEEKHEKPVFTDKTMVSLKERWGIWPAPDFRLEKGDSARLREKIRGIRLPETVSWHSASAFLTDEHWKVIYERDGKAVIAERLLGKGSIAISSDSYFLSNEAMLRERHPALLAWVMGKSRTIIFDEWHLGIQEQPGVAGLARRYRLHGFFWGLLVFAGLCIWKNTSPFLPIPKEEEGHSAVGRDYTDGLISLLRRNISSKEILALCFSEWEKSDAGKRVSPKITSQIQQIIENPDKKNSPTEIYLEICNILSSERSVR